jgi:imidazolonepropionase-like amidohydrolase
VTLSRRDLLGLAAASAAALGCEQMPTPPGPEATAAGTDPATGQPTPAARPGATVFRDGALADGRSASLQRGISLFLRDGNIAYVGPRSGEPDVRGAAVVDTAGATILPGLVDCHAHLSGLGGANWIARFQDPEAELLARAPHNARALARMGTLAARDVGAPRHLNVRIRDDLRDARDAPQVLAGGTWISQRGKYVSFAVGVTNADELRRAAIAELDAGADLVKIAVDSGSEVFFTANDLRPMVDAVHARGKKIAAHATTPGGARSAVDAGADSIEHGFALDAATAERMRDRVVLVSTLSVPASFLSFARTVGGNWESSRASYERQLETAFASVRTAKSAGVRIATGSDFGGGSVRPGHLAWEVELLVRAGLQPHEALAAATWVGGELLGIPGAGKLDVGASGDVVLVHGDPLADPGALWRVWQVYRRGERIA